MLVPSFRFGRVVEYQSGDWSRRIRAGCEIDGRSSTCRIGLSTCLPNSSRASPASRSNVDDLPSQPSISISKCVHRFSPGRG
jgi:hypothetical protein